MNGVFRHLVPALLVACVVSVSAGPVLSSDRAIVDSSFDVAVVLGFDDRRAMAA